MNHTGTIRIIGVLFMWLICSEISFAQSDAVLSGKVSSSEGVVDFASVYLKGTELGCTTDEKGLFHLKVPEGQYTLVVSAVGYQTVEQVVQAKNEERQRLHIHLSTDVKELEEVVVVSNGVSRVKKSAFNAIALDTKALQNSTQNLSEALAQAPGMKLRESGGVGSEDRKSVV